MLIIIIAMCALGIREIDTFCRYRYPEDLFLITAAFGVAMFLFVLWLNGVGV